MGHALITILFIVLFILIFYLFFIIVGLYEFIQKEISNSELKMNDRINEAIYKKENIK